MKFSVCVILGVCLVCVCVCVCFVLCALCGYALCVLCFVLCALSVCFVLCVCVCVLCVCVCVLCVCVCDHTARNFQLPTFNFQLLTCRYCFFWPIGPVQRGHQSEHLYRRREHCQVYGLHCTALHGTRAPPFPLLLAGYHSTPTPYQTVQCVNTHDAVELTNKNVIILFQQLIFVLWMSLRTQRCPPPYSRMNLPCSHIPAHHSRTSTR